MSQKTRSRDARMARICRKKKAFESFRECAEEGAKAWIHNKMYLVPYTCEVCGKYHMTKNGAKLEIYGVIAKAMFTGMVLNKTD